MRFGQNCQGRFPNSSSTSLARELDMDARNPGELLFRVLTADVQRVRDGKTISEEATFEMIQTIQEAVDKIVAAAKAKAIN
jgi:hypothetical protein